MFKKSISTLIFIMVVLQSVLAAEKMLTIAVENTPPYAFKKGEQVEGICKELLSAVLKDSGYTFTLKVLPPKRSSMKALAGEIDGVINVAKAFPLFEGAVFSDTIWQLNINPVTLKETQIAYEKQEDLKSYKIGAVSGAGFDEAFPDLKFEFVSKTDLNIRKLFAKRINVLLEDPVIVKYIIESKLKNQMGNYRVLKPSLLELDMALGFSAKASGYRSKLAVFNQGLNRIKKNGTYQKIMAKWGIAAMK